MKVLVTGGNGFIGQSVIQELYKKGINKIVSFDIVNAKTRLKGVHYVNGTVMDRESLRIHMKGCDAVIHLAAMLGVQRADRETLKCLSINITGTVNVLDACVMSGIEHIVLTSSSEIYGECFDKPVNEEAPFNPKSAYAISKLAGEYYLQGYLKEFGLAYNIIRFFNVYGSNQVAEFVIPKFINMVTNNTPPTVYGTGEQVRSFCHIEDASKALVEITLNKKLRNQSFNIGNDLEQISILALAHKIIEIAQKRFKPILLPFSESDRLATREILFRAPDLSKIKKSINYQPSVPLNIGLRKIIDKGNIRKSWDNAITVG